jgi:GNAT superfamily N-acetyltransferase
MSFRALADLDADLDADLETDLEAVLSLLVQDPASPLTAQGYLEKAESGEYRPERTWIAVDETSGAVLAAAVWWAAPGRVEPAALDAVCVHASLVGDARVEVATALLRAAHAGFAGAKPPEYHVFVPGDWHDQPACVEALSWRMEAARGAGLTESLERLRYEWTPEAGIPEASDRLTFHPEPDDEVFVDILTRVLTGSLDHGSVSGAAQIGAEAQARSDVEFYRDKMFGERAWWRVAKDAAGATVGFGFPSRNPANHVVGYLGVLPEHRGRGYIDDILADLTRQLAVEEGAPLIRADTDLVNVPMAAAFERGGYRNFARRLVFSAP